MVVLLVVKRMAYIESDPNTRHQIVLLRIDVSTKVIRMKKPAMVLSAANPASRCSDIVHHRRPAVRAAPNDS